MRACQPRGFLLPWAGWWQDVHLQKQESQKNSRGRRELGQGRMQKATRARASFKVCNVGSGLTV